MLISEARSSESQPEGRRGPKPPPSHDERSWCQERSGATTHHTPLRKHILRAPWSKFTWAFEWLLDDNRLLFRGRMVLERVPAWASLAFFNNKRSEDTVSLVFLLSLGTRIVYSRLFLNITLFSLSSWIIAVVLSERV